MTDIESAIKNATSIYDLKPFMEDDGYSSCPCFAIRTDGLEADANCWRVGHGYHSDRKEDGYCCVHVDGPRPLAEKIRALLDEADWYGGWALEVGPLRLEGPYDV